MFREINKYDIFIFLLIASLSAGQMGGALQPVRLLAILLFPLGIGRVLVEKDDYVCGPKHFVVFVLMWALFSLCWTYNLQRGMEEFAYYFVHMSAFIELIVFSKYAKNPLKSISFGWVAALIVTSAIAIWELTTYQHLSYSKIGEGKMSNYGGDIVLKQFAAATFYNYNEFELFECYSLPFVLYVLFKSDKKTEYLLFLGLLATSTYIVIANASRGAILTIAVFLIAAMFKILKKQGSIRYFALFFAGLFVAVFVSRFDQITTNIQLRLLNTEMTDGSSRFGVWNDAINCFLNSYCIGTGIGGLEEGLRQVATGFLYITHNMFLEILDVFGIFVFFVVIKAIFTQFFRIWRIKDLTIRTPLLCAFITMPIYSIINSGYLLSASTYLFFASIYVFVNYEQVECVD